MLLRARQATSTAAAENYIRNDPCSPEFRVGLAAAYAPDYMGAAVWHGLRTRDTWCMNTRVHQRPHAPRDSAVACRPLHLCTSMHSAGHGGCGSQWYRCRVSCSARALHKPQSSSRQRNSKAGRCYSSGRITSCKYLRAALPFRRGEAHLYTSYQCCCAMNLG